MVKKLGSNKYCSLLNLLKLSILLNFDYIIISYCKKIIPLLIFLVKVNYIKNFKILNEKTLIVYFNKNQKWKNLKIMYRSSGFFFLNLNNIRRFFFNNYKSVICLTTSKGILTHNEALKLNVGGTVMFYLY